MMIVVGESLVWYAQLFAVIVEVDHIVIRGWMTFTDMVGKGLLLELVLLLLLGRRVVQAGAGTAGTGRPGPSFGRTRQVQLVQCLARWIVGGLGEGRGDVLLVLQAGEP
jgi:hypothetical protein